MRYRLLGPSGLRVSEIALGTLTFGERKGWGASAETARSILKMFADAGGTLIDTAPNYAGGASEEIIGDFAQGQRDNFVLATKFTASNSKHVLAGGNSRKAMMLSVENSLKRLRTDHIDLLWLHYWDATTPLDEIARAMDDLLTAGKILYTGFSDTPAWLISRASAISEFRGWVKPSAIQVEYNLAARAAERELLPMAHALELAVLCWAPMASGALAGGRAPQRRARETVPAELAHFANLIADVAARVSLSPAALALRWLTRHSTFGNIIPIVGARTSEQISNALVEATGDLDRAIWEELDGLLPLHPGFPQALINSRYLRTLAFGQPDVFDLPKRDRC